MCLHTVETEFRNEALEQFRTFLCPNIQFLNYSVVFSLRENTEHGRSNNDENCECSSSVGIEEFHLQQFVLVVNAAANNDTSGSCRS